MDVRPGGVWRFVMHGPDNVDYDNLIVYREVVDLDRLTYFHGESEDDPIAFEVSVTFVETDGRTQVTLKQTYATKEARDFVINQFGAIEGGKQTLGRLAEYLRSMSSRAKDRSHQSRLCRSSIWVTCTNRVVRITLDWKEGAIRMDDQQIDRRREYPAAAKVNESEVSWEERRSPKGRYQLAQRNLTLALGGLKDIGTWGGGHPFDVAMVRMPGGAMNYPRHAHSSTWEYYVILSGRGTMEIDEEAVDVAAGDHIVCPPGCSHRMTNTGDEELTFYVIATNPTSDVLYYPDSDTWMVKPQRKWFRMNEVDYYGAED